MSVCVIMKVLDSIRHPSLFILCQKSSCVLFQLRHPFVMYVRKPMREGNLLTEKLLCNCSLSLFADFLDFLATVALFCCKSRRSALRKYPFRVLKVALLFFPLSFIMVCGCMLPLQSYVPPRCYGLMDCLPVCFLAGSTPCGINPAPSVCGLYFLFFVSFHALFSCPCAAGNFP